MEKNLSKCNIPDIFLLLAWQIKQRMQYATFRTHQLLIPAGDFMIGFLKLSLGERRGTTYLKLRHTGMLLLLKRAEQESRVQERRCYG